MSIDRTTRPVRVRATREAVEKSAVSKPGRVGATKSAADGRASRADAASLRSATARSKTPVGQPAARRRAAAPVDPIKRPGGRSAQVQSQVRAALEQLVAEIGRDQVTVPAVAERAGVSASSIYRRWGDLSSLLNETATHRLDPNRPLPDTGTLQGDLTAWARGLLKHLMNPASVSLLKAAAALASGEDTDCLRNRKVEAGVLVKRAQARGEATPETRQVIDHVVAPIVFRLIFGTASVEPGLANRLVAELFRSVAPSRE